MAYKQEPGRGPTATFKNLTSKGLLGPTADGVDPKTGVKDVNLKREAYERSKHLSGGRKDLEDMNRKAFNKTDIGKPLSDKLSQLYKDVNSKNEAIRVPARKEYEKTANLYKDAFKKYEDKANLNIRLTTPDDVVIQKKGKNEPLKPARFDPKSPTSGFVDFSKSKLGPIEQAKKDFGTEKKDTDKPTYRVIRGSF